MPDSSAQNPEPAGPGIQIGMGSLLVGFIGIAPGAKAAEAAGLHWTAGALIGYWVAVFLFAWILGVVRGFDASGSRLTVPGLLRDRALGLAMLGGVLVGSTIGLWFGPSIGESPLVGAVALGIMGLAPGIVIGLAMAWMRRRSRRLAEEDAARLRFVASLNDRSRPDQRLSIDPDDHRVLITEYSRAGTQALDPEFVVKLRTSIEEQTEDYSAAKAELRRYRFKMWKFRVNGTTILERKIE